MNEIKRQSAFSFAFPIMAPMGISLFVIGLGFGLYATSQGLPWWTAPVLASTIFAGSMEFVTIGMLVAGFDPINAFVLTMFVNGRHFFYGLSALQRYIHMGWKWFPTIAWMCDESFAINMGTKLPDDVDEKWFYFHVSWLNYIFWVFSTFVGGLFGDLLADVDLRGIDFVLPGLFIAVFLEMLLNAKNNKIRAFGVAGVLMALIMLVLVGKSLFMLLSMTCMLFVCYVAYKWGGVHLDYYRNGHYCCHCCSRYITYPIWSLPRISSRKKSTRFCTIFR